MREFNLYLDFYNNKPIEWGVYERGYNLWDNKDYDKKRADKYLFATVCVRNGLIMGFFDVSLSDDDIKISSKTPIYDAYSLNVSSTNYIIVNKQNITVNKINEIFNDISINWENSKYADQLNDLFTVYQKCSLLDPFTEDHTGTDRQRNR